jgi:hypothetical protein
VTPPDDSAKALELELEPLVTRGHPIHTRILTVELHRGEGDALVAEGKIIDMRKCGWVPTAGELQAAGFIHDMALEAVVNQRTRVLERFVPTQRVVAFEANEATEGDSCRVPIDRLRALEGERLDEDFTRSLRAHFGGPLGCSHLLTLGQLMASTLPAVLEYEDAIQRSGKPARRPGERIFSRALFLDGFEGEDDVMELAVQLTDVHSTPSAAVEGWIDRFDSQREVRVLAHVETEGMTFRRLDALERARTRESLTSAPWLRRSNDLSGLVGHSALQGLAAEILRRFGGNAAERPFLDALLNLAPGLIQCLAARANRMIEQFVADPGTEKPRIPKSAGVGGFPDSCYLWRADGALSKARRARVQMAYDDDKGEPPLE